MRPDGRQWDDMRPVSFTLGYVDYPEGSVLIEMGGTRVLCNASVEESVPKWRAGSGLGWVTAEYAMLPRATHTRTRRETLRPRGRSQELKRLIGRSLRAVVNLNRLGERTITLDCDVLQADGGTRTASITGAYVALALALKHLETKDLISPGALVSEVAAISLGLVNGEMLLDLCYQEDSVAEVDFNVVMTGDGRLVELQGTAEGSPFECEVVPSMLDLARDGIEKLIDLQRQVL